MELTEQQKLEILCAYLPYGIEVRADKAVYEGFTASLVLSNSTNSFKNGYTVSTALDYGVQPILRHQDDMTEGEQLYKMKLWGDTAGMVKTATNILRYLHSIHIDTFGAIEAGFAIRKAN
jgi:hypothetical protein